MPSEASRRNFLFGTTAAGLLASGRDQDALGADASRPPQEKGYPRYHAGPGGSVGSATDRGKLVPGLRGIKEPPVLVDTPDLPNNLPWKLVQGVKEFHLHAQPVKRELLPGTFMNHWGFNGTMPGPTIQATQGDRVRIILHNELPEPTTLH